MNDGNLPLYYRESYFAKDSLLHPELTGGSMGVAGDPIPYTIHGDDVITGILLLCFIMALVSYAHSRTFFLHQLKNFFYIPRGGNNYTENSGNMFLLFLNLQTCLLLAIISYFYTTTYLADTFILDEPYYLIAIYAGGFLTYFVLKSIVYQMVNHIFFESKKSRQWIWSLTFITALEGMVAFPIVMMQVYFGVSMQNVVYIFIFILILTKILTIYKCWTIFFRQMSGFLQIILYLCALEIIPLLSIVGGLTLITDQLKVNF